ncbi:cytochrome b561 and DOMON domain-containing protein At3g25290-like [Nymphaea colorata]|nr:cytochrome b561 and DOMON domain-containing protein At3g25290-like [Nymphaea colorata]
MESSCLHPRFPPTLAFLFFLLFCKATPGSSQQCLSQTFPKGRSFDHCEDLPQLGAFLHWSFRPSNSSLNLAFVAPPATPSGWVAWALNPVGQGMIGAQALLAFRGADGGMAVETFNLSGYNSVQPSPISMEVSGLEADVSGRLMMIFATVHVPSRKTSINHVWQVGGSMVGSKPGVHRLERPNLSSKGRLELQSAKMIFSAGTAGSLDRENSISATDAPIRMKHIHGVLSGISWGILLPIGAALAFVPSQRPVNRAWSCAFLCSQSFAYSIGIVSLFVGIHLGSKSLEVEHSTHQNLAWILLSLCGLQVALCLWKPKEENSKAVLAFLHKLIIVAAAGVGVANVFIGFNILRPGEIWRRAYISLLAAMGLLFCVVKVILVARKKHGENLNP